MLTKLTKKNRAVDLRLRRNYGLTLAEYTLVLKYQKGGCAICKRPASDFRNRFAVDHCHLSGLLRGLCCWGCNRAIGVFRDDVKRLKAAVEYLTNPPVTIVFGTARYTAPGRVGTKKRAKLLKALEVNTREIS